MERKITAIISVLVVLVVVFAALTAIFATRPGGSSNPTITEEGSTLLEPVFQAWAPNYTSANIVPGGGGSGTGISGAAKGVVQLGGSDAFLLGAEATQYPGLMNIPIMISYQYVLFNLPGITHLNLSGSIIAGIFMGTITNWDSSLIQAINPGVTLPNHSIIPVHRSDGSGDTFMFTSFLSASNATWNSKVGYGTTVNWPSVTGEQSDSGNPAVLGAIYGSSYTIGYVAATLQASINADHGIGTAALEDQQGQFVNGSVANVTLAANQFISSVSSIPANGSLRIQYAPGSDSYPIADMEYVMVYKNQTSSTVANELKAFFAWALSPAGGSNSQTMSYFNLVPLPSAVINAVTDPLINQIK